MSFAKIRPRRGTATQWRTSNPVLAEGEIGIEVPSEGVGTGLVKAKIGDGATTWDELPYALIGIEPLDYLPLTGGRMSGNIDYVLNNGIIRMQSGGGSKYFLMCQLDTDGKWVSDVLKAILNDDGSISTTFSGTLNGNARGLGIDDTAANRLITQAYTGTKSVSDGRMYVQADHTNKCVNVGILGLGAVGVNKALCDKNGNQIDTTYATRANTVPVFSRGGSYSTLADFMTEAQTGDTCGSSNVFCKFKDTGGWTGEINWYKAWVSWQNGIGNGSWEIDGNIILLRGDSTFKFGRVSGGKTDASDLTVTWHDVATSGNQWVDITSECAFNYDINTEGTYASWVKYNQITKEVKACVKVNETMLPDVALFKLPSYITFTGLCGVGTENDSDQTVYARGSGEYISLSSNKGSGYNLSYPIVTINFIAD